MRTCKFTVIVLILALLMAGCAAQAGPDAPPAPAANDPAANAPTDTPAPQSTDEQPKEATWSIDISDTQQITDEMGLLWNYTLTFHASKPGGVDAAGEYQGEAVLKIEPDMGPPRRSPPGKARSFSPCCSITCGMRKPDVYNRPVQPGRVCGTDEAAQSDNPLAPLNPGDATDCFAITSATFNATQESIPMTISDGKDVISGSVPGRSTTVSVPAEITTDGATAFCFFYSTPHPLARAFKGTVTGDVL